MFSKVIAMPSFDTSRTRAEEFVADAQRTTSIPYFSQPPRMLSGDYFFSACTQLALVNTSNQQAFFIGFHRCSSRGSFLIFSKSYEDWFRRRFQKQAAWTCRRYVESVSCNPWRKEVRCAEDLWASSTSGTPSLWLSKQSRIWSAYWTHFWLHSIHRVFQ